MRVAGIMSGTSLDGIDVALVELRGAGAKLSIETRAFVSVEYPKKIREGLLAISNRDCHTREIARLNFELPRLYARALAKLPLKPELVGCHGQTIYHEAGVCTLQIGDGAVLAELAGVPVISNFRTRDMAAGGQGAPLAPFFDYRVFRDAKRGRVALNLGGIGNVTALPPGAKPEETIAFDTGPGNMVIDQLVARHTKGREMFDRDGHWARRGRVQVELIAELLRENRYYRARPPKSAGREQYGAEFVDRLVKTGWPMVDLIATATAFTAATVADQIRRFVTPRQPVHDLVVSGGGARNPVLMAYLAAFLPGTRVQTSAEYGVDPDAKEAIFFALLAYEAWHGRTNNWPAATGAKRAVRMGELAW